MNAHGAFHVSGTRVFEVIRGGCSETGRAELEGNAFVDDFLGRRWTLKVL